MSSSLNTKHETPDTDSLLLFGLALGGLALLAAHLRVLVAVLELLDAAGGVHQLHLAGEERMAGAGNVQLAERVFLAVGPLDRLVRLHARAGEEREVGGRVLEHDR